MICKQKKSASPLPVLFRDLEVGILEVAKGYGDEEGASLRELPPPVRTSLEMEQKTTPLVREERTVVASEADDKDEAVDEDDPILLSRIIIICNIQNRHSISTAGSAFARIK
jgi:hypothetical protein